MANLRLLSVTVLDSTVMSAKFSEELSSSIEIGNVVFSTQAFGVPVPEVLKVEVQQDTLRITTRPLTPYVPYLVTFQSGTIPFKSRRGNFLLEDGKTNTKLILGAEEPDNEIRDILLNYLKDRSFYNFDFGTLNRDIINSQAGVLLQALNDIGLVKNENYLSYLVENEKKTRGAGPFDRLNEKGAYEVLRVGLTPTGNQKEASKSFEDFPTAPITLQAVSTSEVLVAGTGPGTFNQLTVTLSNQPIVKLESLTITYQNSSTFLYDPGVWGYQLTNPRYDEFASTLLTLADNQLKLSEALLQNGDFVPPAAGDSLRISYSYKKLGRIIESDSVEVTQVLYATREVAPPIVTTFSLEHFPIVSAQDLTVTLGGVEFLDPSANPPFSTIHPAFTVELPFRWEGLPNRVGEYSVDYSTGMVYVFGAIINDGTGDFPPVASYYYRKSFVTDLDFTYDESTSELVASPLRDLAGESVKVLFNYEETLIPGVDFVPQIHSEVLDERVENRVTSTGSLQTLNTPITNVFRVFNETSGEVYRIVRWTDSAVYFLANESPQIGTISRERAEFTDISNETLITDQELANSSNVRIFQILLSAEQVVGASEDSLGASFNTSLHFSRTDLFETEIYFDNQESTLDENLDRLQVGQYCVDYSNGIVYLAVELEQNFDLGSASYKKSTIAPKNSHLMTVSELYHSLDPVSGIGTKLSYSSFSDHEIIPTSLDRADERFLDGDSTLPYALLSQTITVTDDIKDIRGVYDVYDLNHQSIPTNFGDGAIFSGNVISLSAITKQETLLIESGLVLNASPITPGAEIAAVVSVVRTSDNVELYDGYGSFSNYQITLSGANGAAAGQEVLVTYQLQLNGAATPVVDYNRGDYFIDYTYLQDEILVSYEHGADCLDYRTSDALDEGDIYYVTYRVGALRNALLKNFGTLINLPILNNFDTSLPRERYRDALMGALQSFTKGPTIPSMKALISAITHIDPEIIEAAFENWSLGISYLFPNAISTAGDVELKAGKFDQGIYLDSPDQSVSVPAASNLRLEEGTFETWITPDWNGLDNDATLSFSLERNGSPVAAESIFIGSSGYHPVINDDNQFSLHKNDELDPAGLPASVFLSTGVFLYYDLEPKRWKFLVKESIADGYVYRGTVETSGEFYDVKMLPGLGEINDFTRTTRSKIEFQLNLDIQDGYYPDGYVDGYSVVDGYSPGDGYSSGYSFDGFQFMSDNEHYLWDVGNTSDRNRMSILKDGRGFLCFRIWDQGQGKRRTKRELSYDISSWNAGQVHQVAASWKLNTSDRQDEMHLFVDGLEVPNIIKYGGRPESSSSDRFRTVQPELVVGTVTLPSIGQADLHTTVGSNVVYSDSVDFTAASVVPGHTIQIRELGFTTYNVVAVTGFSLILGATMPASLSNARFSINPYSQVVESEVDLYPNFIVSVMRDEEEMELSGLRADIPSYELSKNAFDQNVLTILDDLLPGDQIYLRTLGLNHRRAREKFYFWGSSNIFKTPLPPPISLDETKIYSVLLPSLPIGPDNASYALGVFTATGLTTGQPSNATEGRSLSIRISGSNVNYSTPVTVTILGTTYSGAVSEALVFTTNTTKYSVEKFKTISSVTVVARPIVSSKDSISIEIREKYSVTYPDGNNIYPVIRFSYQTQTGTNLAGNVGSNIVEDTLGYFTQSQIGQSLVISSPPSVANTYIITDWLSSTSVELDSNVAATFSGGDYSTYQTSIGRSGFQNGFFTLEQAGTVNTPYLLPSGWYEFDYSIYLEVPLKHLSNVSMFFGSDFQGQRPVAGVLDEIRILSQMLTDVRTGESLPAGQQSITTDYTRLLPFTPNSDTLFLMHADALPLTNSAEYWISSEKEFLQAESSINENFGKSINFINRPLVIDNAGLLSTRAEGTIEFWVSPKHDTYNDPKIRYYFDASGTVVEEATSLSQVSVRASGRIEEVLSVRLATDTSQAGTNYFVNGSIENDFQTIRLGKTLPSQQTPVIINYTPSGLSGDRISIFKDAEGFVVFRVVISGTSYQVRQPIFWDRNSWHRIRATYKFNRNDQLDELRMWVDGEERGQIMWGSGLFFGPGWVFGQGADTVTGAALITNLDFSDPINQFYLGSDYLGGSMAQARMDNLRLSNQARAPLYVAGQPKDPNYSSNMSAVWPVVSDLYTTYLLNFNTLVSKNVDFSLLRDEKFGIFNFTIDIIDSFGIVSGNAKVKQILETLIGVLKPATSKATLIYDPS